MTCRNWDGDYTLGPFFDRDGVEILPCTTEATDELLADCMGYYRVVSNMPEATPEPSFLLCNRLLTKYIQDKWDEVMEGDTYLKFLLGYNSAPKAVGRLAEEVICDQLLTDLEFGRGKPERVVAVPDACRQGLLRQPSRGYRSDDLLLLMGDGTVCLAESKASFSGTRYLSRCLPKAFAQLKAMVDANACGC